MIQVKPKSHEEQILQELGLLTSKPTLFIGNLDEDQARRYYAEKKKDKHIEAVENYAKNNNAEVVFVCAKVEAELYEMSKEDKNELLQSLGMEESSLSGFALMIFFFF